MACPAWSSTVIKGPVPPGDKVMLSGVTAGVSAPAAVRAKVASRSTQLPAGFFIRVGWTVVVEVSVPSAFATVIESAEVSASTVTLMPAALAWARAPMRGSAGGAEAAVAMVGVAAELGTAATIDAMTAEAVRPAMITVRG